MIELGFELQRLHRLEPRHVLGQERLIGRASQELLVQSSLEQRRHEQTGSDDDAENREHDQREFHAVEEHHRHEDEQERQVQHQRDGRGAHELTDRLDALQARSDHARRPMLEIQHRQLEQMLEDVAAQHRIHTIARVEHEVLPHPRQRRREDDEHRHADGERNERALRTMNDDLVDDRLREQRHSQRHQLQHQGREQHLAPDLLVLQQLGHEPAKSELAIEGRGRVGILRVCHRRLTTTRDLADARHQLIERHGARRLISPLGDECTSGIALEHDEPVRVAFRYGQGLKRVRR